MVSELQTQNSRVDAGIVVIYKGAQFLKYVDGVMVLNLYKGLMVLYICTKFQENISKGFTVIEQM